MALEDLVYKRREERVASKVIGFEFGLGDKPSCFNVGIGFGSPLGISKGT